MITIHELTKQFYASGAKIVAVDVALVEQQRCSQDDLGVTHLDGSEPAGFERAVLAAGRLPALGGPPGWRARAPASEIRPAMIAPSSGRKTIA